MSMKTNHSKDGLKNMILPSKISLENIPSLPLVRACDMPKHAGFQRGALSISLKGMHLDFAKTKIPSPEEGQDSEGRRILTFRLDDIHLSGQQSIQGSQIWETAVDGAGTALPFAAKRQGGGEADKHPTWIATANDQRSQLQDMPGNNGSEMLSTYSNHRAAYNDAFTQDGGYAFRIGWQTQAIADMADHTNTTVSTKTGHVNPSDQQFGNTTYNGNAQNQKLALITALTGMADGDKKTDPYNQAAAAALTFSSTIISNNEVKKINDVPAMTADTVYQQAQTGKAAVAHSVADVHAFINGSPIGGRSADGKAWTMCLTEDERSFVRDLQAKISEHKLRLETQKPVDLVIGEMTGDLCCYVSLLVTDTTDGGLSLVDGRVELDGFDLDFNDSMWDEQLGTELAEQSRHALAGARFIKSLLHDRIADAIERELIDLISKNLTSTVS